MSAFQRNLLFSALGFVFLAISFGISSWADRQVEKANQNRYLSYLAADELRQSSDDLTRLARTYVLTREPAYEKQYMDILGIRNGEIARPEAYNRIYWDFVAATGNIPRPNSAEKKPLLDIMKGLGFTPAEFEKLEEAKRNSDGLVSTEVEAMGLVKKTGEGAEAGYEKARQMMHDKTYHLNKAKIMQPIDDFYVLFEGRTAAAVQAANQVAVLMMSIFAVIGVITSFFLWRTYKSLRAMIGGSVEDAKKHITYLANGDFSHAIQLPEDHSDSILAAMAEMQHKLASILRKVAQVTNELDKGANEICASSVQSEQFAHQQSQSITSISAVIEQMVVSINHVSDNAANATNITQSANQALEQGEKVIRETVESIRTIANTVDEASSSVTNLTMHAQEISAIVQVIRDIADQTNLLALNAAIEAARAGEQGRGFAVVADEVRKLAERTASSTHEIADKIKRIQEGTDFTAQHMHQGVSRVANGVALANQAGGAIDSIRQDSGEIMLAMNEISGSLAEQSLAANEVARNIEKINSLSESGAQAAASAAAISRKMNDLSRMLTDEVKNIALH